MRGGFDVFFNELFYWEWKEVFDVFYNGLFNGGLEEILNEGLEEILDGRIYLNRWCIW